MSSLSARAAARAVFWRLHTRTPDVRLQGGPFIAATGFLPANRFGYNRRFYESPLKELS